MANIKLLLTDNVDNLGIVGDVVTVKPGYARNFLLPNGLAQKPTESAIKKLATRRAEVEKELAEKRKEDEAILAKLEGHEITLQRASNEQGILFGGVSQHDIAQALRNEGLKVEDRCVRIGAQIKRLDSYTVPIVLAADLKTEIKVWVVSDKPSDQLETGDNRDNRDNRRAKQEEAAAPEAAAEPAAEPAAEAPKAKKEKKPKTVKEAPKA
jgi:large subunit ribosomal protein L9